MLPDYRLFKVAGVQYQSGKTYKNVKRNGSIKVKPGSTVKLRIKLTAAPGSHVAATTVDLPWKTSKYAIGTGRVRFDGLAAVGSYDDEEYFGFDEDEGQPRSFDALIEAITSEPRQDYVYGQLNYRTKHTNTVQPKKVRASGIVTGTFPLSFSFKK